MPYLVAINPTGQVGAAMRLDDKPNIQDVIDTLTEWSDANPERTIAVSADPAQICDD